MKRILLALFFVSGADASAQDKYDCDVECLLVTSTGFYQMIYVGSYELKPYGLHGDSKLEAFRLAADHCRRSAKTETGMGIEVVGYLVSSKSLSSLPSGMTEDRYLGERRVVSATDARPEQNCHKVQNQP